MKTATIRDVQHGLAAMIAQVEQGEEILITRRDRPVARLAPLLPSDHTAAPTPAALRSYWTQRPAPPAMHSDKSHADLIAEGRGEL